MVVTLGDGSVGCISGLCFLFAASVEDFASNYLVLHHDGIDELGCFDV